MQRPAGQEQGVGKQQTAEAAAFMHFERAEWAALRANAPLTLSASDLKALRSVNEEVSLDEVVEAYLPLSRLLSLHVSAARSLATVKDAFLGRPATRPPYIIAIAGSVAVGKSTFARVLRTLIARWPDRPKVELITTDGFLHSNAVLNERGLMTRKGFPESYDMRRMINFLSDIKAGEPEVAAPLYSHIAYDIVPGEQQVIARPDVLIFEGLNVLQSGAFPVLASDFFDFSVYLDADEADIEAWYLERFLLLQKTAFHDERAFFHRFKDLTRDEAIAFARNVWQSINLPNLRENIVPTRERANLILTKGADHMLSEVRLRRV
jgi:type I pantothenate kinase